MELYLDLISPPCRSIFLFAKAVGIPFEFKLVELTAGDQYSQDFEKLNILRKIPVMKDGGFILSESTAILKYLAQKCSVADHWFPADLQQRARVNEYLSWQHMNLRAHCSKVFLLKALFPFVMGCEPSQDKVDAAMEDMALSLNQMEEKFLQSKPFIIGNKISLADVVAMAELMQPLGAGVNSFEGRPKLLAWRDRVKKELGEKLFEQAHEVLMDSSSRETKLKSNTMLESLRPTFQRHLR